MGLGNRGCGQRPGSRRIQEDPGGSRRIQDAGGLLWHAVAVYHTSDVQGHCWEAKPGVPAFASRKRQLFSHLLRPMPYSVGLKLQRPRHIGRYPHGQFDVRSIIRFWQDYARCILIDILYADSIVRYYNHICLYKTEC